jgi:hypothetical protein
MNFYREESSNPKWNAQRNLQGRTHYVDDDTLRFHKSRIISSRVIGGHDRRGGLLFAIITSDALDMNNTRRGFRFVIFDIFGSVLERPDLDNAFRTSEQARKAMWQAIEKIDAQAHTLEAIERQRKQHETEMNDLRDKVLSLSLQQAA